MAKNRKKLTGPRLQKIREKRGMTILDVVTSLKQEGVDMCIQTWRNYELDISSPRTNDLSAISKVLRIMVQASDQGVFVL